MSILDKGNLLSRLDKIQRVCLELGCGNSKRKTTAIGIDVLDYECVDIVGDAVEVLRNFPSHSAHEVYTSHFFEHIVDVEEVLREIERVVKPGGTLTVVVPHFSNPYYYSDYTHRSFFGLYTFSYLTSGKFFKRGVPTYKRVNKFELIGVDLRFSSTSPFYVRHVIKVLVGKIFNLNNYFREFYEENLCYLFPCYEIEYRLRQKAS